MTVGLIIIMIGFFTNHQGVARNKKIQKQLVNSN